MNLLNGDRMPDKRRLYNCCERQRATTAVGHHPKARQNRLLQTLENQSWAAITSRTALFDIKYVFSCAKPSEHERERSRETAISLTAQSAPVSAVGGEHRDAGEVNTANPDDAVRGELVPCWVSCFQC